MTQSEYNMAMRRQQSSTPAGRQAVRLIARRAKLKMRHGHHLAAEIERTKEKLKLLREIQRGMEGHS